MVRHGDEHNSSSLQTPASPLRQTAGHKQRSIRSGVPQICPDSRDPKCSKRLRSHENDSKSTYCSPCFLIFKCSFYIVGPHFKLLEVLCLRPSIKFLVSRCNGNLLSCWGCISTLEKTKKV